MTGYYFSQIIALGYFSYFMNSFGYSESAIGVVVTIYSLSAMVLELVFGFVMDKYCNPKLILSLSFTCYTAMQVMLFYFFSSWTYVVVYASVAMGLFFTVSGLCDSWVVKIEKATPEKINYSRIRAVGSISYALIGLAASFLMPIFGYNAAIGILITAWIIFMYACFSLPNPPKSIGNDSDKVSLKEAAKVLGSNGYYILLLVCVFMYSITNVSYTNYYSLFIKDLGGGTREVGIGLFVMAFTEFWVMRSYKKYAARFGDEKVLAFSFLGYVLRSVLMALARNFWAVLAVTALQTISFALQMPGIMACISKAVSYRYQATAVQVMYFIGMIGQIAFSALIGSTYENLGRSAMLMIFAIPSAAAFIIFSILSPVLKKKLSGKTQNA